MMVLALVALAACNAGAPPAPSAPLAPRTASPLAEAQPVDAAAPPPDAAAPRSEPSATEAPPAAAPISCTNDDDCWVDEHYAPIARPKKLRGKKLTPCKGGHEHIPACRDGVCSVIAYKC